MRFSQGESSPVALVSTDLSLPPEPFPEFHDVLDRHFGILRTDCVELQRQTKKACAEAKVLRLKNKALQDELEHNRLLQADILGNSSSGVETVPSSKVLPETTKTVRHKGTFESALSSNESLSGRSRFDAFFLIQKCSANVYVQRNWRPERQFL